MFSKNRKISEKQLRRMIVLPVFASIIFVVPYVSANLYRESIVPGLLLFVAMAGLYVLYICGMGVCYEQCAGATGNRGFAGALSQSGLVGGALILLQVARLIVRLGFYILLTIAILEEAQVPFMLKAGEEIYSDILVALPLLLIGVYGANVGVEKQGRIHELLFWVLFIPFLVMIVFGLKEVDYSIFFPRVKVSFGELISRSYLLLAFVLPVENYLYLRPDLRVHKEKNRTCIAVIGTILLACVLILFALGIYGVNGAADSPMVTIDIMRYIRLPFGVLERFDVLMIWFFIVGCFLLICETLYFAKRLVEEWYGKRVSVWGLLFLLVLALLVVVVLRSYTNGLLTYVCYAATLDIPLSLLLPVFGVGLCKLRKE